MNDNLLTSGWSTDGEGLLTDGWSSMAALTAVATRGTASLRRVEHNALLVQVRHSAVMVKR